MSLKQAPEALYLIHVIDRVEPKYEGYVGEYIDLNGWVVPFHSREAALDEMDRLGDRQVCFLVTYRREP